LKFDITLLSSIKLLASLRTKDKVNEPIGRSVKVFVSLPSIAGKHVEGSSSS
jgi:hypothetical protein